MSTFLPAQKGFDTQADMREFIGRIADQIISSIQQAESQGQRVSRMIGVGAPGRFKEGALLPSDHPGMGKSYDGFEFSKVLIEALSKRVNRDWVVSADNDGARQRDVGIYEAATDPAAWELMRGKKAAYIGLGTGIGGGFAEISESKTGPLVKRFYTDGHIGDLRLPDGSLLHDFLSTYWLQKELGLNGAQIAANLEIHTELVGRMGLHLGRVMEAIHSGQVEKTWDKWPDENYRNIKGTSVFILGGSIGTRGELARRIQAGARAYLKSRGLDQIQLVPIAGDSAAAGIVGAALPPVL